MRLLTVLKKTGWEFFEDDCLTHAAALAYYTVFSLPPLLLIVVSLAGSLFGSEAVQSRVYYQVSGLAGTDAADQIRSILAAVQMSGTHQGMAAVLGIAALAFGATSAFAQLQWALNRVWNVKPDPKQSEIRSFLVKRLISFGMILCTGFLMLVSLLLSAGLAALSDFVSPWMPDGLPVVLQVLNLVVSLIVFAILFTAMYKFLPDVVLSWLDAAAGGVATAILFIAGKHLIGLYLGNGDATSVYGAAGSLAVILFWTYYSSVILLLGAEFTRAWSQHEGHRVPPEPGAMKVRQQEVRVR